MTKFLPIYSGQGSRGGRITKAQSLRLSAEGELRRARWNMQEGLAYGLAERFRRHCENVDTEGVNLIGLLDDYIEENEPESVKLVPVIIRMLAADLITLG